MTAARLNRILRTWQRRLKLEHWDITLDLTDHDIGEDDAAVWKSWDYNNATVYVKKDWRQWSQRMANYYLCHELLHVAMRDVDYHARQSRIALEPAVAQCHRTYYLHALENFVDATTERLLELGGLV